MDEIETLCALYQAFCIVLAIVFALGVLYVVQRVGDAIRGVMQFFCDFWGKR